MLWNNTASLHGMRREIRGRGADADAVGRTDERAEGKEERVTFGEHAV